MLKTIRNTGKAGSIPTGLTIAAIISIIITLVFSGVIASFLNSEKMTWTQAGYWIMFMLFIAAFIAAKCANSIIKRQQTLIASMSGIIYWGILLCITGLFFGGNFDAVPETAGIIIAGSLSQLLLFPANLKTPRRNGRK